MPIKSFWNTLATQDPQRSRSFYSALGFEVGDVPGGAGITVKPNESSFICFFGPEAFAATIPGEPCDASRAQEVIQSIAVDSREEVDALIGKVQAAGGQLVGEAKEQPFGYAGGFRDPDGHAWAVLWMPASP